MCTEKTLLECDAYTGRSKLDAAPVNDGADLTEDGRIVPRVNTPIGKGSSDGGRDAKDVSWRDDTVPDSVCLGTCLDLAEAMIR
jgi:hypothetical protein